MKHPPLKIEIALRVFYSAALTTSEINHRSAAHTAFLRELINENIVEEMGSGLLKMTERGRAWIEMVKQTPFPRRRECWVDPRTDQEVDYAL